MAVFDKMFGRSERVAIPALERHTAIAGFEKLAMLNAMSDASVNDNTPITQVAESAI